MISVLHSLMGQVNAIGNIAEIRMNFDTFTGLFRRWDKENTCKHCLEGFVPMVHKGILESGVYGLISHITIRVDRSIKDGVIQLISGDLTHFIYVDELDGSDKRRALKASFIVSDLIQSVSDLSGIKVVGKDSRRFLIFNDDMEFLVGELRIFASDVYQDIEPNWRPRFATEYKDVVGIKGFWNEHKSHGCVKHQNRVDKKWECICYRCEHVGMYALDPTMMDEYANNVFFKETKNYSFLTKERSFDSRKHKKSGDKSKESKIKEVTLSDSEFDRLRKRGSRLEKKSKKSK